jgi:hypothetical protein
MPGLYQEILGIVGVVRFTPQRCTATPTSLARHALRNLAWFSKRVGSGLVVNSPSMAAASAAIATRCFFLVALMLSVNCRHRARARDHHLGSRCTDPHLSHQPLHMVALVLNTWTAATSPAPANSLRVVALRCAHRIRL